VQYERFAAKVEIVREGEEERPLCSGFLPVMDRRGAVELIRRLGGLSGEQRVALLKLADGLQFAEDGSCQLCGSGEPERWQAHTCPPRGTRAGSVVRLRSGGPKMTVVKLMGGTVLTMWFTKGKRRQDEFPSSSLVLLEE